MQEIKLTVQNICLSAIDNGKEGKPGIIFLHGSSESSKVWYRQLNDRRLAEQYRLIAIDLPGHGNSECIAGNTLEKYSLRNMAETIREAVAQLRTGAYIFVGFSLGTNILAELKDYPAGCKGLFLIGASVANKDTPLNELMLPFEYGHVLTQTHSGEEEITHYVKGLTYRKNAGDVVILKNDYEATDPQFRTALANCFATVSWDNEIENLRQNPFRTMFVFGANEEVLNCHYQKEVLSGFATVKIIEEAGHLVQLDQPDKLNELLLQFAGGLSYNSF